MMAQLLGWLVATALLLVAAWLAVEVYDLRQLARERRIAMEEAQAWADEFLRERDITATECTWLRERVRTLQALYTDRTRESLAANYWIIASNVEWKKRLS